MWVWYGLLDDWRHTLNTTFSLPILFVGLILLVPAITLNSLRTKAELMSKFISFGLNMLLAIACAVAFIQSVIVESHPVAFAATQTSLSLLLGFPALINAFAVYIQLKRLPTSN